MASDGRYGFDADAGIVVDASGGERHDPDALRPVLQALLAKGRTRPQLARILVASFGLSEAKAAILTATALGDIEIEDGDGLLIPSSAKPDGDPGDDA